MKIHQVFTPNDTPKVTYVDRSEHKLEQRLRDYYSTPNLVISVSGPSKSGKTVLIKKVISEELLIPIAGAGISSANNLWERALDWMGAPTSISTAKSKDHNISGNVESGGKAKIPLVAEGSLSASGGVSYSWGNQTIETTSRDPLNQVIREIADSEFVVFIDDFHYIKPEFREEIGRQIKAAAENGVKVITASVPHRADDVVRSNPELRGRVAAIDMQYWTQDELRKISEKGFDALNVKIPHSIESNLAMEAFGSPQLMQAMCLNLCFEMKISEKSFLKRDINISDENSNDILLRTASFTDFAKMLTALHTGPRIRGTERKLHDFLDETGGDVYRAILLAIKDNPAELSFSYDNIINRVRAICLGDVPAGSSITSALEQMNIIGEQVQPGTSPISWDSDEFVIADPYFLFFLRNSDKLKELGNPMSPFTQ